LLIDKILFIIIGKYKYKIEKQDVILENTNINWVSMTDSAIIKAIGAYIKHQRLEQNKTQAQVAGEAGINTWTLSQIENGEPITLKTLIQIFRVLDLLHLLDIFTIKEKISPIEYAKLKEKEKKRARAKNKKIKPGEDAG